MFNDFPQVPMISWLPVLTCATPGDLAVTYTSTGQFGICYVQGRLVTLSYRINTATFTWSTASGNVQILGAPLPPMNNINLQSFIGNLRWSGITKASFTSIVTYIAPGSPTMLLYASGSGQASTTVVIADLPTSGGVILHGTITYII